jgi:hypothetical protein
MSHTERFFATPYKNPNDPRVASEEIKVGDVVQVCTDRNEGDDCDGIYYDFHTVTSVKHQAHEILIGMGELVVAANYRSYVTLKSTT